MPNIELLEKSMPVAPIRIAALGCRELAEEVDRKLVKFRKELVEKKSLNIIPQGYSEDSFLVDCECPRFGTGEGKGIIKESVRGTDLAIEGSRASNPGSTRRTPRRWRAARCCGDPDPMAGSRSRRRSAGRTGTWGTLAPVLDDW